MFRPIKCLILIMIPFLILTTAGCKKKSLDRLLEQEKFGEAEMLCKSLEGAEKIDCYKRIAGIYVRDSKFERAAMLYKKIGAHIKVLEAYYIGKFYPEAEAYGALQTGKAKKDCAAWLGRRYYKAGNYSKAIQYYTTAEDPETAAYITSKIPVFQLVEALDKIAKNQKEYKIKKQIEGYANTLREYIYLNEHREWKFPAVADNDKKAAEIYAKAFALIEKEAAPVFIEKIKNTLKEENAAWTEKRMQPLAYDYTKLDSLTRGLDYLRKIAGYRRFFDRYPVESTKKSSSKDSKSTVTPEKETIIKEIPEIPKIEKGLNYDKAYKKALENAAGILETVKYSKDLDIKIDYKILIEDFGIDIQNLDYITSMLKNVQLRINDIRSRAKLFRKSSEKKNAKAISKKQEHNFIAACSRVLLAIGKADYQEANRELLAAYEKAGKAMPVKKRRIQK